MFNRTVSHPTASTSWWFIYTRVFKGNFLVQGQEGTVQFYVLFRPRKASLAVVAKSFKVGVIGLYATSKLYCIYSVARRPSWHSHVMSWPNGNLHSRMKKSTNYRRESNLKLRTVFLVYLIFISVYLIVCVKINSTELRIYLIIRKRFEASFTNSNKIMLPSLIQLLRETKK